MTTTARHLCPGLLPLCVLLVSACGSPPPPAPDAGVKPTAAAAMPDPAAIPVLPDPPSISSSNGILNVSLTPSPSTMTFNGKTYPVNLYNGLYVPPVWRFNPGDTIKLLLTDRMSPSISGPETLLSRRARVRGTPPPPPHAPMHGATAAGSYTNLHYHGFNVTPLSPSDNVFLQIFPVGSGQQPTFYNYTVPIPLSHPEGMFWFHPHPHGQSEGQVLGGMSGAAIVNGLIENYYPQFKGLREHVMLLKDFDIGAANGALLKTINGLPLSMIPIKPGELQFWRLANVAADAFFDMQLQDQSGRPIPFYVIAVDGNPTDSIVATNDLFLGAGARMEVIVVGPASGTYVLKSLKIDTGPQGDPNPEVILSYLFSSGQAEKPMLASDLLKVKPAKVDSRIARLKEAGPYPELPFVFSETADGNTFFINNREYDPNRVDTRIDYPCIQQWNISNTSGELHVFHIHQLDFLVTAINGKPVPQNGLQDTITLPYQQNNQPGTVTALVPFLDRVMLGEFVYHCHILGHEDNGMMANILVRNTGKGCLQQAPAGKTAPAAKPARSAN
jgi:suppressor of ftsI